MDETVITDWHLVAELSKDEYVRLRIQVAESKGTQKPITLKQYVGQAIREKLDGIKNEEEK